MQDHPSSAVRRPLGLVASLVLTGVSLALSPLAPQSADGSQAPRSSRGERVPVTAIGEGRIVDVMALHREQAQRPLEQNLINRTRNGAHGIWAVPSASTLQPTHSGERYIVNKWGDTSMGIGFPAAVDLDGAWIAGQSHANVWPAGLRVIGFRDGQEVSRTGWFTDLGTEPAWFAMDLENVDRVVFEAQAAVGGAAWYALDDLTYRALDGVDGEAVRPTVIDFDDLGFKAKVTKSGYRGLTWETGTGDFESHVEAIEQPLTRDPGAPQVQPNATQSFAFGGAGTSPDLQRNFRGAILFDPGANYIPPDTVGAVGLNHFVEATNTNFSVFTKNGTRVVNISQASLFGIGGDPGDARVAYDPHSQRFFVISTDFDERVYLAVSTTNDPTGSYFTTEIVVTQGADSGAFPDYPTLGVDANGVYIEFAMFFSANVTMTIFVLDKAPLVAGSQSLGAVTAFRGLPWQGAMQPCVTYGTPGPEYIISWNNSTNLRLRRVTGPRSSPTLTDLGNVSVPFFNTPPDVPAMGASVPIDSVDDRLMNAVYRNGSVWAAHAVERNGRAAVRWYEINPLTQNLIQSGTVQDNVLGFVMPTLAVNANDDVVLGFSGSSASQFPGAYYCGRLSTDPAGQMSVPIEFKAGQNSYEILDSFGRNRWGDYSLTSVDPVDDLTFWTVQEYTGPSANTWRTWIAELTFPSFDDCNNNGIDDLLDISGGFSQDCDSNSIPDECDPDCDNDGTPDACEPDCDNDGTPDDCETGPDCNSNGTPDECELAGNDCNSNGIPDDCELSGNDCNSNGTPDDCDPDCDNDGTPDDCEPDCDNDGTPDDCEPDCDNDGTPDDCEADCDNDGTPDDCEPDCDNDGTPDDCEPDCDNDGTPDDCEPDCDNDGTPDDCETGPDCNSNGVPDNCELAGNDCNSNGIPDDCELSGNDCDSNGTPDECDPDCDNDGTPDDCEPDCDNDGTPDDCETGPDCNSNGIPDECELGGNDCDSNGVPDECDPDCDNDGTPDDCEPDCDNDGTPDDCETGPDCNSNGTPDECELGGNDCNSNGIPDDCELAGNDCNSNGTPDDCELSGNDCNSNGTPDECELSGNDCNSNGTPDDCELGGNDCNSNGTPDDCELSGNDCNTNGVPDECDISSATSADTDGNGIPDECEFIGAVYCPAAPNSAGPGAEIRGQGSSVVAANDFRLRTSGLPSNVFGVHFYGPNQIQAPFGDGFRCVGGQTQRIQPIAQADAGGVVDRAVDLTVPALALVVPSSTWNFQFWYRDQTGPGGTGFNLTNGIEVSFQ